MSNEPLVNRQLVLRRRPEGLVTHDDFELVRTDPPEPAEGEALIRTLVVGIDATVRTWLNKGEGYLPAVELGEAVRASGVGRTVATRNPDRFPLGGLVYGLPGWQDYALVRDDGMSTPLAADADPAAMLSVLGATGLTAYFGLTRVGEAAEGDTVVVSAAAGATGSAAVQIAQILGCRVIGIAGTAEKCRYVTEELGAEVCLDYRLDDLPTRLKELCPKGVDVYFDNVGGSTLDAVLGRLAIGARVALCGAISSYNEVRKPPGPANYLNLISRRAKMQGFISLDWWGDFAEGLAQLQAWVDEGRLQYRICWFDDLAEGPDALNALFTGANIGKILLRVAPDDAPA